MQAEKILHYMKLGVDHLCTEGHFDSGDEFRRTQHQALEVYRTVLDDENLPPEEKLKGFFELFTSAGKTALFAAIIDEAHAAAEQDGAELKTAVVVPRKILLQQTRLDFEKFAPRLAGKIGLYGGGRKNLRMPVTIMTYEAFDKLSKSKKIGSNNINILISDEAHKGTSERLVESIDVIFNGAVGNRAANQDATIQLAYTATAHFDEVKSVRQSHEREIFSKTIRQAMLEGAEELAAYVQGQTVIIRVPPTDFMLSDEFKKAAIEDQVQYRKRLKQDKWNEYALTVFREGRDEHSEEPLTDNQAAFFVDGIEQGNKLEKLLNEDPELQRRAAEQGCKAVAAVIHSKLSDKEQERRLKAYRNGEYMAIIGDEIFKEGFDYAPLKTIIDFSHGSIVDKAQILGRGTRAWWNPHRQRNEGLAFVDTIIYIGSRSPDFDEKLKKQAMRKAVSLKQILGDAYVLNAGTPERKSDRYEPRDVFGDDPNVEYYASIEDVYHLGNEIEKLREAFVLTMEGIIATIDAYRETHDGKNPFQSLGMIEEGPLEGLMTWQSLNNALKNGAYGLSDDPAWQELSKKWADDDDTFEI